MEDLRYPIGKFQAEKEFTPGQRQAWIADLERLPGQLREAVKGLTGPQLETPYRPGGWTLRQVVHHLADSHIHSYIRFRFGLTEPEPTIKPYDEGRWADLEDARSAPLELSLALLEGIHGRWVALAQALNPADFNRVLRHPERGLLSLDQLLHLYSWHSRHHLAHITGLRQRSGW